MESKLQELMNTPPQDLLEELNQIRERERLVTHERELLERVLEILVEKGGPAAEWLSNSAQGLLTIGPLRAQILQVMQMEPGKQLWMPREVHEQLVVHGNNKASLDNVRVTMRRMAAADELLQPKPSTPQFALPPDLIHGPPRR
jgi:hypothetical protein